MFTFGPTVLRGYGVKALHVLGLICYGAIGVSNLVIFEVFFEVKMKFSRAGVKRVTDSVSAGKNIWENHSSILRAEKMSFLWACVISFDPNT